MDTKHIMSTCAFSKYLLHEWHTWSDFISQVKGKGLIPNPSGFPFLFLSCILAI